jgi:putative SOS response-associated peptidase YedK
MCGRFSLFSPGEKIAEVFGLPEALHLEPRYNVAPTQLVLTVIEDRGRRPQVVQWGLVPSWAKDPSGASRMINARSETVAEKPAYRAAFHRRRCLIPADNFFAWKKEGARPQAWLFRMRDKRLFAFAGIWEIWERDGHAVASCCILTTTPNELMRPIHHRMPVVLPESDWDKWLSPEIDRLPASWQVKELMPMLRPFPAEEMSAAPVGDRVNDVRNDDPRCLEPLESGLFD